MTGSGRALLYRLAAETGLRAGEIRNWTPRSFDLEGEPPTVTVEAGYSKPRREDAEPLPPNLAADLRTIMADRSATSPVFAMPPPDTVVKTLRADLADARSVWIDEALDDIERDRRETSSFLVYRDRTGRVAGFHALRHTFVTNLARAGVHPKQAQDLARHSDINLTMSRYSHTLMADRAAALKALPGLTENVSGPPGPMVWMSKACVPACVDVVHRGDRRCRLMATNRTPRRLIESR